MSRLFIQDQEIDFFNLIGKELIQDVVGQRIIYYSVSDKLTHSDTLYGEAVTKTVYTPVEINARILYNAPEQVVNSFSIDTVYSLEVYFLLHELEERGIVPREGDFIQYGNAFYEIQSLTKPQLAYGYIDHKVQMRAICRIAREGQFQLPPVDEEKLDG